MKLNLLTVRTHNFSKYISPVHFNFSIPILPAKNQIRLLCYNRQNTYIMRQIIQIILKHSKLFILDKTLKRSEP